MDAVTFIAVLIAALMHASWNLVVKKDDDKSLSLAVMAATSALVCLLLLPVAPPIHAAAWRYLLFSVPLHAGYRIFLGQGYRHGNLSQVYPLARGATPLFVTAISLMLYRPAFGALYYAGILLISLSIIGLTRRSYRNGGDEARAIRSALMTSLFVACFSLVDGAGSRASGHPISYILCLFIFEGMAMVFAALALSGARAVRYARKNAYPCLLSGIVMSLSHGIVIWAFSRAEVPLVAALRESSVVIGMCLSTWVLKERVSLLRALSTFGVLGGMLCIAFG